MAGLCDHGIETLFSINEGEFLDYVMTTSF
jgi:hypothetical protein